MVKTTEACVPGIGPVTFQGSLRARNLRITVQSLRRIRVVIPEGMSLEKGKDFLQSKKEWVVRQLQGQEETLKRQRSLLSSLKVPDNDTAKIRIAARLEALASQYGFSYNKFSVRNQKTCWGSCSHGNNISLNIHLARIPARLMDYVILHELLHTRIKSHGPVFWNALEEILPGAQARAGELKKYPLEFFSLNRG